MTVDDVLAWRNTYGDLIGKSKDAVIERYGEPDEEGTNAVVYAPTALTLRREVSLVFVKDKVLSAKVYAKADEELPVMEVIKRAPLYDFESGTFQDSTHNYFIATSKDGRNSFQFEISENTVRFHAAMFRASREP